MTLRTLTKRNLIANTSEVYISRTDLIKYIRSVDGLTRDEEETFENMIKCLEKLTPIIKRIRYRENYVY